jgi:threonine aldolase
MIDLRSDTCSRPTEAMRRAMAEAVVGVHMLPAGPNAVRAVFYLDIADFDAERASELVGEALHSLERQPEETLSTTTSAQY